LAGSITILWGLAGVDYNVCAIAKSESGIGLEGESRRRRRRRRRSGILSNIL